MTVDRGDGVKIGISSRAHERRLGHLDTARVFDLIFQACCCRHDRAPIMTAGLVWARHGPVVSFSCREPFPWPKVRRRRRKRGSSRYLCALLPAVLPHGPPGPAGRKDWSNSTRMRRSPPRKNLPTFFCATRYCCQPCFYPVFLNGFAETMATA